MALWDRLADWLEPTLPDIYRCRDCGSRFGDDHPTCPECGGTLETDDTVAYNYWGPL